VFYSVLLTSGARSSHSLCVCLCLLLVLPEPYFRPIYSFPTRSPTPIFLSSSSSLVSTYSQADWSRDDRERCYLVIHCSWEVISSEYSTRGGRSLTRSSNLRSELIFMHVLTVLLYACGIWMCVDSSSFGMVTRPLFSIRFLVYFIYLRFLLMFLILFCIE
jgi:hypothetical protein